MSAFPISPLSLNQLTRDYWGQYDPVVIAQLAALAQDPCYQIKFYKAPADDQEVIAPFAYVTYGMRITPGSIIFGFYLPCFFGGSGNAPTTFAPALFTAQITDVSLEHKFWDDPVSALMLANYKPTYQADVLSTAVGSTLTINLSSFPNLLVAPYPVVGSGQLDVEIQSTSGDTQRIELVFGVLEVCNAG